MLKVLWVKFGPQAKPSVEDHQSMLKLKNMKLFNICLSILTTEFCKSRNMSTQKFKCDSKICWPPCAPFLIYFQGKPLVEDHQSLLKVKIYYKSYLGFFVKTYYKKDLERGTMESKLFGVNSYIPIWFHEKLNLRPWTDLEIENFSWKCRVNYFKYDLYFECDSI